MVMVHVIFLLYASCVMSNQPILTREELIVRMKVDLDKFKADVEKNNPGTNVDISADDYIISADVSLVDRIKSLYRELSKDKPQFDYHETANDKSYSEWITRTKLFYHMMTCLSRMIYDVEFRSTVYGKPTPPYTPPEGKLVESHYKLGIFGSMNANSDIDVGVTYIGGKGGTNRVADVVKMFEDMSLILLGVTTLQLDIEMYAGMVTIQCDSEGDDPKPEDRFFVNMTKLGDISNFWKDDMKSVRVLILTSILRSMAIGKKESGDPTDPIDISGTSLGNIWTQFNAISKYDDAKAIIEPYFKQFTDSELKEAKTKLAQYIVWLGAAATNASSSYNILRDKYYAAVRIASETIGKIECGAEPTRANVIQYITETAESDLWRAESYMMAPTVVHVVRIMQSGREETHTACKYPTTYPVYATCSQTPLGYMISAFEQMGYIIRFNGAKEKYIERFADATSKMGVRGSVDGGWSGNGGRRRSTRKSKRNRKCRSTRKRHHTSRIRKRTSRIRKRTSRIRKRTSRLRRKHK